MNFEFFENLSIEEANSFLQNFLIEEERELFSMKGDLAEADISLEFDLKCALALLHWTLNSLITLPEKEDDSLPSWIKSSSSYKNGLFQFDEPSKLLILRSAYYMGECFVRSNSKLRWGVGDVTSAVKHMPVVTGFNNSMEMSPIMILENVFSRILANESTDEAIEKMLDTWQRYSQ